MVNSPQLEGGNLDCCTECQHILPTGDIFCTKMYQCPCHLSQDNKSQYVEVPSDINDPNMKRTVKNAYIKPVEDNKSQDWSNMYLKLKPLIEEIKSRYPKECNIQGLEPALSTDIVEIVSAVLLQERESIREKVGRLDRDKPGEFGNGYNKAIDDFSDLFK